MATPSPTQQRKTFLTTPIQQQRKKTTFAPGTTWSFKEDLSVRHLMALLHTHATVVFSEIRKLAESKESPQAAYEAALAAIKNMNADTIRLDGRQVNIRSPNIKTLMRHLFIQFQINVLNPLKLCGVKNITYFQPPLDQFIYVFNCIMANKSAIITGRFLNKKLMNDREANEIVRSALEETVFEILLNRPSFSAYMQKLSEPVVVSKEDQAEMTEEAKALEMYQKQRPAAAVFRWEVIDEGKEKSIALAATPNLQVQITPSDDGTAMETQPVARASPKPAVTQSSPKPAIPSPKPVAQPSPKPVTQPSPKPVAQPSPKPIAQPVAQPSPKPAVQPAAQPVAQPSPKPAVQPAAQPVAQPSPKPAVQPVAQPSPGSGIKIIDLRSSSPLPSPSQKAIANMRQQAIAASPLSGRETGLGLLPVRAAVPATSTPATPAESSSESYELESDDESGEDNDDFDEGVEVTE